MGIIRLLLVIAALWLAWRLIRSLLLPRPRDDGQPRPAASAPRMLRCERCGVHVPEGEAFSVRGHHFCSQEHQREWLEHHDG